MKNKNKLSSVTLCRVALGRGHPTQCLTNTLKSQKTKRLRHDI